MTKKTNTVEIEYAGGTATVIIKNENGTDDGDTPNSYTYRKTNRSTNSCSDRRTYRKSDGSTNSCSNTGTNRESQQPPVQIKLDKEFNEEGTFDLGGWHPFGNQLD